MTQTLQPVPDGTAVRALWSPVTVPLPPALREAVEIGELRALTRESDTARLLAQQETARADALEVELFKLRAEVARADALKVAEIRPRKRRLFRST